MKKQKERVTVYRLEWIQGGEEMVEEHAIRARAQGRFEVLRNRRDVVEIEFVKVGPNGREGIDFWISEDERERRLDECIASEGRGDPDEDPAVDEEGVPYPPESYPPGVYSETQQAITPKPVEGLRGRRGGQPIEPDPAYEAAHSTAHDLIQRLVEKLHDLPAPDGGCVTWAHVKFMNDLNRSLFTLIETVEKAA